MKYALQPSCYIVISENLIFNDCVCFQRSTHVQKIMATAPQMQYVKELSQDAGNVSVTSAMQEMDKCVCVRVLSSVDRSTIYAYEIH